MISPRLGIFCWFGYEMSLRRRLELIAAAGFGAASLWWGPESRDYRCGRHHDFPAVVRDLGLHLDNVHVSYQRVNDLWNPDDQVRRPVLDQYLAWLDDCARHAIGIMVVHKSKGIARGASAAHGLESFRTLTRRAAELNIILAVENTRRLDQLALLFHSLTDRHLGFCYDSGHEAIVTGGKVAMLPQLADRLATTHFADTDGVRDRHWLPGEGVVDWPRIAAALPRDYAGNLLLEVIPTPAQRQLTAESFLALAHERLRWLADMSPLRPYHVE